MTWNIHVDAHMPDPIEIVNFTSDHLDAAVRLSASVGWPHQRKDWAMLHHLSRGYIARSDNRVVGTAFRTDFGSKQSCINMIIVDHSMRGAGLGYALTSAALHPDDTQAHRLVATALGQPLYQKIGFKVAGHIVQMKGPVKVVSQATGTLDAMQADLPQVRALDANAFGGDRVRRGPLRLGALAFRTCICCRRPERRTTHRIRCSASFWTWLCCWPGCGAHHRRRTEPHPTSRPPSARTKLAY